MYKHHFLCTPRLWQSLSNSVDEFSIITTNALSEINYPIKGLNVQMPFKEGLENPSFTSFRSPYAFLNRLYFSFKARQSLKELILTGKIDLVHCFGQFAGLSTISLAKSHKIPVVFTTFNPVWSNEKNCTSFKFDLLFSLEKRCIRLASKVLVPSDDLAMNYVRYLDVRKSHIGVLPNPVDTELFSKQNDAKYDSKRDHTIVFVARISPHKNQLALVKAIPMILRNVRNIKFLFVGPIGDYSYYNQIMTEIRRNKLDSVVRVLGTVPLQNLIDIYREADMFVILSLNEAGLPLACLEAMSSGLPLIVSDKPYYRQYLSNELAVFVDPHSIDSISKAVIDLILDKKKREEMSCSARALAERLYSLKSYAQELVSIYQNVISENKTLAGQC